MKKIYFIFLAITSFTGFSQTDYNAEIQNKGKFFFYWGWNVAGYTRSDIHFKGDNYDFTLKNVKANDRPTDFSVNNYFNPLNISIPQTNFRLGYFFKENYTLSIGFDHLKYVVEQEQTVRIQGEIGEGYGMHSGVYSGNDTKKLTRDFLQYEHTDGLNYVNVGITRFDNISKYLGLNCKNFQINLTEGVGAGILYPRTDSELLGKDNSDHFHISGYGVSAKVGLNFTFWKHFFLQSELKTGFIDLTDVRTTNDSSDSGKQNFAFLETVFALGWRFQL